MIVIDETKNNRKVLKDIPSGECFKSANKVFFKANYVEEPFSGINVKSDKCVAIDTNGNISLFDPDFYVTPVNSKLIIEPYEEIYL
jgi:hypothetical protein